MKFHCTLVRSPGSGLQESPSELTINAPVGTAGDDVHAQLIQRFGTGTVTIHGNDIRSMTVGEAPLVNGAVLVCGTPRRNYRTVRRRASAEEAHLALAVHTGVGAGTVVPLRRGSYSIGRSGTRIVIPDPELSREHARLDVTETDIMIVDTDSANGIHVDGERVRNAVISTDSSITCGNTTMSLVFMDLTDKALADAGTSTQRPLTVPGRIDTGNRAMLVLTAILPLLIGIGLAVLSGMWMFLAFAAASAISVLVPLASGRRQRRDLAKAVAAAVAEDRDRRRRSGPSLAILALTAHQGQGHGSVSSGEEGVWLRLGVAPQPANVKIEPSTPSVSVPSAGTVPVSLDPAVPRTTFCGPAAVADGVVRSLVMQLAGYPRSHGTRIVIGGRADRLPLAARYLHGVILTASAPHLLRILNGGFGRGYQHGVLLLLPTDDAEDDGGAVRETAAALGWQVLEFLVVEEKAGTCDVELSERRSLLQRADGRITFVPDLAPEDVFRSFCRQLATHAERSDNEEPAVPDVCPLEDVLPLSQHHTAARWKASARDHRLNIPLGLGARGPRGLDLQADGPHLLVAGTTGSGKSELLRSLTLALALSYPPERVNFLFVFKGGSGLGPLTELVHCVGLLTDLSADELERTLTSLRAEIRLREQALASARVPDLVAYRATNASEDFPLPHLVIVIDEFRMLVDDAPEALRELLRIAAIGRSLGIHLVMGTQRPQGALTADIRANVTSSIALRVQSDMESLDIINSKAAASISVDAPGRAFLARGTEAPQEFQTSSIGLPPGGSGPAAAVTVQLAATCLGTNATARPESHPSAGQTPAEAAAPLVAMVRDLWRQGKVPAPRRPVAPALPPDLPAPQEATPLSPARSRRRAAWCIELGLLDLPEKQSVMPLEWSPAKDSHLALIGAPSSGATEALELAVMQLVRNRFEAHGYILDAGGTFLNLATHPSIGAYAGLHELRRAVRVLERLKKESGRRLGEGGGHGDVPLVLIISGWGSWISAFRAGPLAWAEDLVQDLARDGGRAGIIVMVAGDRELVSSRAFSALPNRLFFPAGSNMDSRIAWPRIPATATLKGRAVAFGPVSGGPPAVCQLYSVSPHIAWDSGPAASLTGLDVGKSRDSTERRSVKRPFRVEQLPALVPAAKVRPAAPSGDTAQSRANCGQPVAARGGTRLQDLLMGVGGDELEPKYCSLKGAGVLTVLGGPGSGKTNVLRALPLMNPDGGPWLSPEDGTDPGEFWKRELATAAAGEAANRSVALVDDVDLLSAETIRHLSDLNALGCSVVLTASYSSLLIQRVPLVMCSRSAGTGLLLKPRSLQDSDLFGVRFEVEANAPPGRGVLISQGVAQGIQVGWADTTGNAPLRACEKK
ncbi:FtsK/SpoIIIE domain-containing protein [Pseudarthrobacter sp. NPDC058329]|uniref:FtsK/SpoIIIE domain-containing protein n=1 Tax=Pseudarthrobacter sp. NPDC058329 TaxID=3346448 RepID=UPI0036DA9209